MSRAMEENPKHNANGTLTMNLDRAPLEGELVDEVAGAEVVDVNTAAFKGVVEVAAAEVVVEVEVVTAVELPEVVEPVVVVVVVVGLELPLIVNWGLAFPESPSKTRM